MHIYYETAASEPVKRGTLERRKASPPKGKLPGLELYKLLREKPGLSRGEVIHALAWSKTNFDSALLNAEAHGLYLSEEGGRYYAANWEE